MHRAHAVWNASASAALVAVVTAAVTLAVPVTGAAEERLDGRELLSRMAKRYLSCRTYQDNGVVQTVFVSSGRTRTEQHSFRTAFRRPDRFRFEFGEAGKRFIVWKAGSAVRTWWDIGASIETPESLNDAIAGATGVSNGTALTIPLLLMPSELRGWKVTELEMPSRIPDARLGRVECFRVSGKAGGNSQTVWLDRNSYLLLCIEETVPFAGFSTEQRTTYEPVVDGDLAEDLLVFGAPRTH